jgi:hypothetical protein
VQVALGDGGELRNRAGRYVLDVVARLLQQFAGNGGRNVLAGPFVDRQLDRLVLGAELGRLGGPAQAQGQQPKGIVFLGIVFLVPWASADPSGEA